MQIIRCEQRTEEWFQARLGMVTASHFKDVMNKKTGRETYMMRLVAERMTGMREDSYSNKYMEEGIEKEPEAREHYEWITDNQIEEVGFVKKDDYVGCSPDALVGTEGILETKCPMIHTHLRYLLEQRLPPVYKAQVQGQLWVCERKWCDFISYCPDYEPQRMFVVRVKRDETYLTLLSAACAAFVTELKEIEDKLRRMK